MYKLDIDLLCGTSGSSHCSDGDVQDPADLSACRALGFRDSHAVWTTAQSAQIFLKAIELFLDLRSEDVGAAVFDKDDALAVEFVAAASNLRSACYSIPNLSLFELKVSLISASRSRMCSHCPSAV